MTYGLFNAVETRNDVSNAGTLLDHFNVTGKQ